MPDTEEIQRKPKYRYLVLDGFWLKVIALLTMTFDHVGVAIDMAAEAMEMTTVSWLSTLVLVFRIIGRFSFPIFLFLLAEGMRHTHSRGAYILRLTLAWAVVFIFEVIFQYGLDFGNMIGQAFNDLLPLALFVYLIEHKRKALRPLALLPLAYMALSYVIIYMGNSVDVAYASYAFLMAPYNIYGLALFLLFYYGPKIVDALIKRNWNLDDPSLFEAYKETKDYRFLLNMFAAGSLVVVDVLFWAIFSLGSGEFLSTGPYDIWSMGLQSYSILAAVLLACYSGARGYNAKWFRYGSYAYYPLHIAVIFGIAAIVVAL